MSGLIKRFSAFFITLCFLFALTPPTHALDMDTRSLAMINKPGVVLVQTIWTADVTWYEISLSSDFEEDLVYEVSQMIINGEIGNSDEEIYGAMIWLMANYMEYYAFYTGNTSTERMSTAGVGTGFIVTPDGYMVTNAHVVETDEDDLYMQFAMTGLESYAIAFADEFEAEMRRAGYWMTDDEWYAIANAYYSMLSNSMEISNLQTNYYCYIGNVTPGSDVSAKGTGLDLRKIGEPIPGKDIAILKIDGTNLPTVTLGDDTKLRTGDRVYAMGYPAVATLTDALNVAQAIQEPTLTQGIISARKEMAGGWSILQTDAAIHGGNSGGPLFNEAGEVVGINTFGMIDESGMSVAGINFAIPISVAQQFLHELNIEPTESDFTSKYKEALSLFQEGKYNESAEILRGLNETNPGFPVVADLLAEARTLADSQPSSNPTSVSLSEGSEGGFPVLPVAIGGGALIIVVVVVLVIVMRKKRAKTAHPTPPAQGYALTQNQAWPQQVHNTQPSTPQPPAYAPPEPEAQGYGGQQQSAVPAKAKREFCTECGAPTAPGKKFCGSCGAKIPESETTAGLYS